MANQFHVLPISLHEMTVGLAAVAADVAADGQIELNVSGPIANLSISARANGNALKDDASLRKFVEDVASIPACACAGAFLRNHGSNPQVSIVYKMENTQHYFQIDAVPDRPTALKLVSALAKHFTLMSRTAVLGASLPPDDREVLHFKEQVIGDLGAEVSRLGLYLAQMGEKNSELIQSMTSDLEKQFQQKRTDLETHVQAEKEKLNAERSEFEKQRKEFDDRQRTHVRRDLLTKIQKNIDERAKSAPITAGASQSRLLIHIVSWLFIVISAVGGVFAGRVLYEAAGHSPFDWRVVPPFSAAVLLFGATLVFYFRWISRWADRLAFNDLAVQQYASDVLRASWIAELLFEYNDEKQKEIPQDVLASLTEGLFKREEFRTVQYHPSDDVTKLLRRLKSFKAGPQGVEITADGKQ